MKRLWTMRACKHVWRLNSTPCVLYTNSFWNTEYSLRVCLRLLLRLGRNGFWWMASLTGSVRRLIWKVWSVKRSRRYCRHQESKVCVRLFMCGHGNAGCLSEEDCGFLLLTISKVPVCPCLSLQCGGTFLSYRTSLCWPLGHTLNTQTHVWSLLVEEEEVVGKV